MSDTAYSYQSFRPYPVQGKTTQSEWRWSDPQRFLAANDNAAKKQVFISAFVNLHGAGQRVRFTNTETKETYERKYNTRNWRKIGNQ